MNENVGIVVCEERNAKEKGCSGESFLKGRPCIYSVIDIEKERERERDSVFVHALTRELLRERQRERERERERADQVISGGQVKSKRFEKLKEWGLCVYMFKPLKFHTLCKTKNNVRRPRGC